jgi:hypothetical protein
MAALAGLDRRGRRGGAAGGRGGAGADPHRDAGAGEGRTLRRREG